MNILNYFFPRKGDQEKIRYVIKGDGKSYNVTFKCSGECEPVHREEVPRGWSHTFVAHPGDYYYFSAQSNSRDSEVELRVYQNGRLYKKISKSGQYPLAIASGLLV